MAIMQIVSPILTTSQSNEGIIDVAIPFLSPTLIPNTSVDWNYTTVPLEGLDNRVIAYPRGKLLGGSTSISEYIAHTPSFER